MSGWWFSVSASSPTWFTKSSASRKSLNENVRSSAPSTSLHPSDSGTTAVSPIDEHAPRRSRASADSGASSSSRAFFGPLADRLALALRPLRVPPTVLVLANGVAGLAAVLALLEGAYIAAALLLQLKTLLDNADGRLARVSGRVTLIGRYLDTEVDLAVNVVLFAALGHATGEPWLALAAFVALTFVLSVNFNLAELTAAARGVAKPPPAPTGGRLERTLERLYALGRSGRRTGSSARSPSGASSASWPRSAIRAGGGRRRSPTTTVSRRRCSRTWGSRRSLSRSGPASSRACPSSTSGLVVGSALLRRLVQAAPRAGRAPRARSTASGLAPTRL